MRVLFATHDYPFPITYGGQVYSGNVVKELAKLVDRVHVVAFDKALKAIDRREAHGARWTLLPLPSPGKLTLLTSSLPNLATKHRDEAYWRVIADALVADQPDLLVIDYIAIGWIAPLARALIAERGLRTRTLYMSHNVETMLRRQIAASYRGNPALRLLARYDATRAGRLERMLCEQTDMISVETHEDADAFRSLFDPGRILIAPPGYAGELIEARTLDASVPRAVTVLGGRLSTMKQIVLDELLECAAAGITGQGVALHLIGPMTPGYQAATTAKYPDVAVHGFVEDVKPLLSRMRAGIVADHVGGGFKHRILTHVFYRVPMIALPEAMVGLPLTPGEDYHPITSYADVPHAVSALIDDVGRLDRFQDRAFARCAEAFSWPDTIARFTGELAALAPAR